jgi:hypothetical protein
MSRLALEYLYLWLCWRRLNPNARRTLLRYARHIDRRPPNAPTLNAIAITLRAPAVA